MIDESAKETKPQPPFAPGDTAKLRSGGPTMTVEWCEERLIVFGSMIPILRSLFYKITSLQLHLCN